MKKINFIFLLFALNFLSPLAFAGGGDIAGGTSGSFVSLKEAQNLAVTLLNNVKALPLKKEKKGDKDLVRTFYKKHRLDLIEEIRTSEIHILPMISVFIEINGSRSYKLAATSTKKSAPIKIAKELGSNVVYIKDLVLILLHEVGHHLGVEQEADAFLDEMAVRVMEEGLKDKKELKNKLYVKSMWELCTPDLEPTFTPHCVVNRISLLTSNENNLFQLEVRPYGTCKSQVIGAGTFLQVIYLLKENQSHLNDFYCATVVYTDLLNTKLGIDGTPYCSIEKVSGSNQFKLVHSSSTKPIFMGTSLELKKLIFELIDSKLDICPNREELEASYEDILPK